jgi:hypothetical protein
MDMQAVALLSNGTRIRITGNNLLVRPDPEPKQVGLIHLPDGVCEGVMNTGVVLARGYVMAKAEFHTPIPGIQKGNRVAFIRFLAKQDSNTQLSARLGESVIRIRASDVTLVFDDEDLPRIRPDLVDATRSDR